MNLNITSSEHQWKDVSIMVFGRKIAGLRGYRFKKSVEKEHLFGAGQQAIDIQEGNVTVEGSITVLGFELNLLNKAAQQAGYSDITEVPHEAIVIIGLFKKKLIDPKTTVTVNGVAFTEFEMSQAQNDKFMEVELPFIAMDLNVVTI